MKVIEGGGDLFVRASRIIHDAFERADMGWSIIALASEDNGRIIRVCLVPTDQFEKVYQRRH